MLIAYAFPICRDSPLLTQDEYLPKRLERWVRRRLASLPNSFIPSH